MSNYPAPSPSFSMGPPPRPLDTSYSAMQSRVDELEKIKHLGHSKTIRSIQEELRETGEEDWTMMAERKDDRGVLWERKICQELDEVQKGIREPEALRTLVTEFRTILHKHSTTLSVNPLRALIGRIPSAGLPEVECLKFSLLSLRINDIKRNDPDGKVLNSVQHYLNGLEADLHLANQKREEKRHHYEEQVAQLHQTILNTDGKISDLLWKVLGEAWFNRWNKTVNSHWLPKRLLLLPQNDPRTLPASHSIAHRRRVFVPVKRQNRLSPL